MREYLYGSHYDWSLDEEPTEFGEPRFARRYPTMRNRSMTRP
jgi:hypothetical protein